MNRKLLQTVAIVIGLGVLVSAAFLVKTWAAPRGKLEGRTKTASNAANGKARAKKIFVHQVAIVDKKLIALDWRNNTPDPISYIEARLCPASAKDKAKLVAIYDGPPIAPGATCRAGPLITLPFEKLPSDSVQVEVDAAFRADEVTD